LEALCEIEEAGVDDGEGRGALSALELEASGGFLWAVGVEVAGFSLGDGGCGAEVDRGERGAEGGGGASGFDGGEERVTGDDAVCKVWERLEGVDVFDMCGPCFEQGEPEAEFAEAHGDGLDVEAPEVVMDKGADALPGVCALEVTEAAPTAAQRGERLKEEGTGADSGVEDMEASEGGAGGLALCREEVGLGALNE
jgi:hypothetical protein